MLLNNFVNLGYGTRYIINDKGERTAVIVPIHEHEDLIHKHHFSLELSDDYKSMIDEMLRQEENGTAKYVSFKEIQIVFMVNSGL